jgi:8-oxo-dGTP diphosphatase
MAIERLKAKVTYTNIVFALLPKQFTLTELQDVYETILCQTLDKRNFRKKILSLDWLIDQKKMKSEGAHRPAELYSFQSRTLQTVQVL